VVVVVVVVVVEVVEVVVVVQNQSQLCGGLPHNEKTDCPSCPGHGGSPIQAGHKPMHVS